MSSKYVIPFSPEGPENKKLTTHLVKEKQEEQIERLAQVAAVQLNAA